MSAFLRWNIESGWKLESLATEAIEAFSCFDFFFFLLLLVWICVNTAPTQSLCFLRESLVAHSARATL